MTIRELRNITTTQAIIRASFVETESDYIIGGKAYKTADITTDTTHDSDYDDMDIYVICPESENVLTAWIIADRDTFDTATIRISPAEYDFDYDIREEICGDVETFEETYVITGNDAYKGFTSASWWQEVQNIVGDMWDAGDGRMRLDNSERYDADTLTALSDIYDRADYITSADTALQILRVLYPERHFVMSQICGSVQREWQYIIYPESETHMIESISAYYWGRVSRLYYEEENVCAIVDDDTLYAWEASGHLTEELRQTFDIDDSVIVEAYEFNGYTQTASYQRIG